MRIGFLSNQLDNRGTGDALYNYAHYNEEILKNKSVIYTYLNNPHHNEDAKDRFIQRFGGIYDASVSSSIEVDALYHIKSGEDDGFRPNNNIPYLVHTVFNNDPHGTVYATISPWMGQRFELPYVPHIVQVAETNENLREALGIPKTAVVFGRHGGTDSFDIDFVKGAIYRYVRENPNVYFVFMNTDVFVEHSQVKYLPATVNPEMKRKFINTCDAMIHARSRGETFGIAVGEFAICGKPVITYSESHEKAHIQEIGHFALLYKDESSLLQQFDRVVKGPLITWGYGQYTPENVMKKFKEVFLDALS